MAKNLKILFFLFVSLTLFTQERNIIDLKLRSKALPFGLTKLESDYDPRVYLTLSGGGARAISQLGVLKAFQEENIDIDGIVGTSMGSIIGGLYSAGYSLDQLDTLIIGAPWDQFFSLEETSRKELFPDQKITEDKAIFAIRLDGFEPVIPTAINTGQRVSNFLNLLALNAPLNTIENFDNLLYSFEAVSTNLITGEPYILDKGSLSIAMRASSSVSLVLEPVKIDSLILVDGGLVANNPVSIAQLKHPDYIISVDASSPLRDYGELKYPWEIADQIVSIPMRLINEDQLNNSDWIIKPSVQSRKNTDFTNLRGIIDEGYKTGIKNSTLLKSELRTLGLSKIPVKNSFYNNVKVIGNQPNISSYFNELFSQKKQYSKKEIIYEIVHFPDIDSYSDITASIEEKNDNAIVEINAVPNPVVENIIISGANLIDADSVLNNAMELKGKPFNSKRVLNSLLEILREYRKKGYSLVRIQSVDFSSNTIKIEVDEQKIDDIKVEGNEKTNLDVITRELPFEKNDDFIRSEIEEGLNNLRSTNLFESIDLMIEQNGDKNILELDVKEKPSLLLRFGLRIDTEYLTQLSLDLREENFLGTGTELGGVFTGGIRNQSLAIEHRANRIFDTYLTYKIKGFFDARNINTYVDDSTSTERKFIRTKFGEYRQSHFGGSIGVGAQFEKLGNIMVEGRYQQDRINGKEDFPSQSEYTTNIAALRFTLAIDSQNKYPFPTNGVSFNGYYETAQTAFGGDLGYSKLYMNYSIFFPINNYNNVNLKLKLGFADETLPLSQQFSFGGQSSFFGYRDYEFRGRQIFISSLEYRVKMPFKLFFDTYLKARYDLGSIWNEQEQIRFKDLRHGIGATLALDTPIGPAEFSIGKSFLLKNTLPENIISWGETLLYFTIGYYY